MALGARSIARAAATGDQRRARGERGHCGGNRDFSTSSHTGAWELHSMDCSGGYCGEVWVRGARNRAPRAASARMTATTISEADGPSMKAERTAVANGSPCGRSCAAAKPCGGRGFDRVRGCGRQLIQRGQ